MTDIDVVYLIPPFPKISETLPLGGGYLVAALRDAGIGVKVVDYHNGDIPLEKLAGEVMALGPRVVGMSANTPQFVSISSMVEVLKRLAPDIRIVVGGPHITALGGEAMRECRADVGIMGEGDLNFPLLVKSLMAGDEEYKTLPGVVFRDGDRWVENPRGPLADVNRLSFPAWEYFDIESYQGFPPVGGKRGRRSFPITTSRGCPYRCSFCAYAGMGRKYRARTVKNVVDEIEWLRDQFGMDEFYAHDDNMAQDTERAKEICRELIKRNIDIPYRLPLGVHVNTVDKELIELLKASGCYQMGLGLESFDPNILKLAHKPITGERIHAVLKWAREAGLYTFGYFIIGLPGSTWETETATIDEAARSDLTFAHFSVAVPYPGCELYEMKKDELPHDWDQYFHYHAVAPMGELTVAQLKSLMRRSVLKFYLRPKRFRAMVSYFGFKDIRSLLKVLAAYFYK